MRRRTMTTAELLGAIPSPYVELDAANYVTGLTMPNSGSKGGTFSFNVAPTIDPSYGKCFNLSNYFAQIQATLPNEFSLEFWLKRNDTSSRQLFECVYAAGVVGVGTPKLSINSFPPKIIDYTEDSKSGAGIELIANSWNHIVYTFTKQTDGTYSDKVYLNAIFKAERIASLSGGYDGFWNFFCGFWGYITGLCTVARMYNVVLSQSTINSLFINQKARHGL